MVLSPVPNPTLLERFARNGLDPSRVELVGRCSREEYLKLFNRIDIALDPFPYNGDTTTCDGLWMGAPIVTLAGDAFVSRRGVSHLANAGLAELIARTPEEYVGIAVRLARDPDRRAELRGSLRQRMREGPLANGQRYTAHLEQAYRRVWRAWCGARN
jgi:predicted O-linked N-acetylglucosamine transferase (SPINDLY family)